MKTIFQSVYYDYFGHIAQRGPERETYQEAEADIVDMIANYKDQFPGAKPFSYAQVDKLFIPEW